jgi:NAD(P)-dependent dehydrogenase (short-subunit alcohol dehydrogenase family)
MTGKRLEGRIAVVTGGGRGLGRAICLALAAEGASVVVVGRSSGPLQEVAAAIAKAGGKAQAVASDVGNEASVNALFEQVVAEHGGVDVLVNSAGTIVRRPAVETSAAEWQQTIDTNLSGAWFCCVAAGRRMLAAGRGKIINIASTAGAGGRAGMAAYCASKAGVINLTRALAIEWAAGGVYVNAIAPGQFETDMGAPVLASQAMREEVLNRIPLRRIGQPRDIGPLAVFLASADSDMVTGEIVFIDGGVNAL